MQFGSSVQDIIVRLSCGAKDSDVTEDVVLQVYDSNDAEGTEETSRRVQRRTCLHLDRAVGGQSY